MSIHQSTQALLLVYTHLLPRLIFLTRSQGARRMVTSGFTKSSVWDMLWIRKLSIHGNNVQSTKTTQQATPPPPF